ncbi:MAG: ABC transporter ATP-binding protein [Clostridiales bacterium GWB2_37_7]|nr:MAG: ABC transporter ATP-binding protein [Clostridiales bacterium GWB2_37_7]
MISFSINELNKYYGANHVLKGLSFEIFDGEKVGLLGKNGAGKSTLFKILAGLEIYESGCVSIPEGVKVGVLDQIPVYPEHYTVIDVLMTAFEKHLSLKQQMNKLEHEMAVHFEEKMMKRYGEIQTSFETMGGYTIDSEIAKICNGLQIDSDMQQREFKLLSGGEKTRVNLGRILLQNTNVLLLDEPTNHLDIVSTEWIEKFLKLYKGTVIVISHDRYFLDNVVTRIVEIVDGQAELYQGSYSYYAVEKEERYIQQMNQYQQEQKKIQQLELAAKRMHEWAKNADNAAMHRRAFSIEKRIERMDNTDKPFKEKAMTVTFNQESFSGKEIAVFKDISKAYDGNRVLDHINVTLYKGDRIALLGKNGCGKTTLLRIVIGEELPDTGMAKLGDSIKYALLQQNIVFEKPERTVLDTIRYDLEISDSAARNMLAAYKFKGNDVFKKVEALSGGERTRLSLCLLMQKDVNMLILDEPTNHLDIASREWIEECVTGFEGTILFVSHDRYFISRFADKIWELEDGKINVFNGSYEEHRESKEKAIRANEEKAVVKNKPKAQIKQPIDHTQRNEKQKLKLEAEISDLEAGIKLIETDIEQTGSDYVRLQQLIEQKEEMEAKLERLYEKWLD